MTIGGLWIAPIAVPLPVVLMGGAGAVVATAAVLSAWAAHHPELPTRRWSRPLPASLCRGVDARATRIALRALGLVAGVAGIVTLAGLNAPVDGVVAIVVVTAVSMVAGPVIPVFDPIRVFDPLRTSPARPSGAPDGHHEHHRPKNHAAADVRTAAVWSAVFCAIALSAHDPRLLAATATGYVLLRLVGARRGLSDRSDPVGALAELMAHLAPIGRNRDGLLAWRNPLVAVAHAEPPLGAVDLGAVVTAASLTHAALQHPTWLTGLANPISAVVLFGVVLAVVAGVLRLALIRPFLRSATVPMVAAYGIVAAGRWLPPLDVLAFVALHMLAIGVLHRQALARYDLRTARAVQFPTRIVLVLSVISGLTLLVAR